MTDYTVLSDIGIREMAGRQGVNGLDSDSAERSFRVWNTSSPLAARDAILSQDFYEIWEYDNLVLSELSYDRLGPKEWQFDASYANVPNRGGYTISIDTTGGVVKQTEAFAQTAYNAPGFTAIDYGTSVDVQDGKPQGVDRIIPALKLDITARIHWDLLSGPIQYAKTIATATGSTNLSEFLTFARGELLFAGATGDIITERDPTLTFTFIASSNLADFSIGPISGITKAGHDYVWVSYLTEKDTTSNRKRQVARAAYVSRIYTETEFSNFNIGVLP